MSTHELDLFDMVAVTAAAMPANAFTKPDDDWVPIAFLEGPEGQATFPLADFMENDRAKDLLTEYILPQAITKFRAHTVVIVLSAWQGRTLEPGTDWQDRPRPSEDPERKEILMLIEYTRDGIQRNTVAEIIRYEDSPPTLGEWESWGDDTTLGSDGRFVGPIVAAMKRVK
jgi:hypothetical protein